ncbi:beta-galactosidase [Bacillus mangrovi]|uniref:Beta-galactosidase n=1 Tax=Metabacillus mangrovi TaxID=1491830 RepID=A0A7X2S6L5_9BACI|nr:glycoside hydrolase family 35 protein [Metabacillus mangrovi]MTH54602.1 beta-galactosidase [Metabacillus mangrovi]
MLTEKNGSFQLNGEPFQILSGSIHYFRVVPEYWEDRLSKLKMLGLNTVETYIPWNVHEPVKGEFQFEGMADLEQFIKTADGLGLHVILRPAPYICAEWEFGGLPAWLLRQDLELRSSDPVFLKHLTDYFNVLLPKLVPYLTTNGGPVIAVQIENEYGAYGNDRSYLQHVHELYKKARIDVLLFTSDGPDFIRHGSIDEAVTTLNFGSKAEEAFEELEAFKPGSPLMCAEYWIGWFDHWGGKHHTRSAEDAADVYRTMLKRGASVNFYMFHGGTNFGFMNGANHYEEYTPTITSYDYDALLTEWGDPSEKYFAVKNVLKEFTQVPEQDPEPVLKKSYGKIQLQENMSLFDYIQNQKPIKALAPRSMEEYDHHYGLILYRTTVEKQGDLELDVTPIRDRAFIYVNGKLEKTVYRNDLEKTITLPFSEPSNQLEILVENMGRVNYGKHLKDRKGVLKNLWLGAQYWFDWEIVPVELDRINWTAGPDTRYPRFFRGELQVESTADTFIDMAGWTKGYVWINGFNLGRYWPAEGPQTKLYIPGPLLKEGANEVTVLELEGTGEPEVWFSDKPGLGEGEE